MSFKLIRVSKLLTALRFITILLCIAPVFVLEHIKDNKYIGIWILICLLFFLIQLIFIRRYKTIGKIDFQSSSIRIEISSNKDFLNIKDYEITIEYNGYKGRPTKGTYTPLLSLSFDEGIGTIVLKGFNKKFQYSFLSERRQDLLQLNKIISDYIDQGVKINLIE
jgi:hypothetical protein